MWDRGLYVSRQGAHGEQGREDDEDTCHDCTSVQPEARPRDHHQDRTRQERVVDVILGVPLEGEIHFQAAVLPCVRGQLI